MPRDRNIPRRGTCALCHERSLILEGWLRYGVGARRRLMCRRCWRQYMNSGQVLTPQGAGRARTRERSVYPTNRPGSERELIQHPDGSFRCQHGVREESICYPCRELRIAQRRQEEQRRLERQRRRTTPEPAYEWRDPGQFVRVNTDSTAFTTEALQRFSVSTNTSASALDAFNRAMEVQMPDLSETVREAASYWSAATVPPNTRVEFVAHDDPMPGASSPEMEQRIRETEQFIEGLEAAEEAEAVSELQEDDIAF